MAAVSSYKFLCVPWPPMAAQTLPSRRQPRPSAAQQAPSPAPQEQEPVQALSDILESLMATATAAPRSGALACGKSLLEAPENAEASAAAAEAPLQQLLDGLDDGAAGGQEGPRAALVRRALAFDLPRALLTCLPRLDFEARKLAARALRALLRLAATGDACGEEVVAYVRDRRELLAVLLDGCADPEVSFLSAQVLQGCAGCHALAVELFDSGAVPRLLELAQHQSFDIASEAFATLRELLLREKGAAVQYLLTDPTTFFNQYHACLTKEDAYTLQRQALHLLSELLLDGAFVQVMLRYVADDGFLQIQMNLLRNQSVQVRLDAFHIFKIFVANPTRPARVEKILAKNRDRLVKLLESLEEKQKEDPSFVQDLQTVLDALRRL